MIKYFLNAFIAHQNTFGGEIELRARLESYISTHIKIDEFDGVPVVLLVIDGDEASIQSVFHSIKNCIPCIFVDVSFLTFVLFCIYTRK